MKLNKFMFIFAHPDDETVACAATIRQLVDKGCEVELVVVTDGGAGEVMPPAQKKLQKLGSISALRQSELSDVQKHLGISEVIELNHPDGAIDNQIVWGKLTSQIVELIDLRKPDVVVTFDHTGWYFHLDHVGTSIATTLAYHQSKHRPTALLLSHFYVNSTKWRYVYGPQKITHRVQVHDKKHKLACIDRHSSQDLTTPRQLVTAPEDHYEWYELAFAEKNTEKSLKQLGIFEAHQGVLE